MSSKLSLLPSAGTLDDDAVIYVVTGGASRKKTFGALKAELQAAINYPEVANFAALPAAADHSGEIYVCLASQGTGWLFTLKESGFYRSNGSSWTRLGALPADYFTDSILYIADDSDPSKVLKFQLSAITTATTRTASWPDASGTVYLEGRPLGTPASVNLANGTGLPLSGLAQTGATSNQVPQWNGTAWAPATLAGGGGGDMLSTLTGAEISITGTATLTISRMHVCSGTSSNYTVTLPPVSGNAGKFVGLRMAPGLTKLVTLDGDGSETINGELTRTMWANEAAILLCDGTSWAKVAGKSIPMNCTMALASNTSSTAISADTPYKVLLDTIVINSLDMADITNSRIYIRRAGVYTVAPNLVYLPLSTQTPRALGACWINGAETWTAQSETPALVGTYAKPRSGGADVEFAAGDYSDLRAYLGGTSGGLEATGAVSGTHYTVKENIAW